MPSIRRIAAALLCATPFAPVAGATPDATRPYCATRPSLGAGSCIVAVGHPMLEMGVYDWQRERDDGVRTDSTVAGDALLRVALGRTTEVQLGWTAVGGERVRDPAGTVARRTRIGDMSVALRRSLVGPDGTGFSIAVQPFVTLPTGRRPIGAGTWGAGLILPVGYPLGDSLTAQLTGEVDALSDGDGHGRHPAYSAIAGLAWAASDAVSTTVELSAGRDRDPDGAATLLLAALSGGYQLGPDMQVDGGTAIGLNHQSPALRLFVGFSRRF